MALGHRFDANASRVLLFCFRSPGRYAVRCAPFAAGAGAGVTCVAPCEAGAGVTGVGGGVVAGPEAELADPWMIAISDAGTVPTMPAFCSLPIVCRALRVALAF